MLLTLHHIIIRAAPIHLHHILPLPLPCPCLLICPCTLLFHSSPPSPPPSPPPRPSPSPLPSPAPPSTTCTASLLLVAAHVLQHAPQLLHIAACLSHLVEHTGVRGGRGGGG
ncbi:unnamed protein product [Closterium sp. NIES-54]